MRSTLLCQNFHGAVHVDDRGLDRFGIRTPLRALGFGQRLEALDDGFQFFTDLAGRSVFHVVIMGADAPASSLLRRSMFGSLLFKRLLEQMPEHAVAGIGGSGLWALAVYGRRLRLLRGLLQ